MPPTNSRPTSKRHCMIVHAYYPLGETRVQREAEALLNNNYQVDVICLRRSYEPPQEQFKGTHIYRLPVRRYSRRRVIYQFAEYLVFFLLAMFKVSLLHRKHQYSTIQVHNPPDFLVFAAWLPRLLGAKLIIDLHDLMTEFYMGRFQKDAGSLPVRLVRLQERLACRFAHHVITVSHHWKQALTNRGVPAEKISVVMNVADDNIFRPAKKPPGLPENNGKLHLFYHGTVTKRYGLDLALQAIAQLQQEENLNLHLTILGAGEYWQSLVRLAGELNLTQNVSFELGFRPAEELPQIIMTADAGIVPYRNDPFTNGLVPTKLMEYAALGLPSIAAKTEGIARYFDDTMVEFFTPGDVKDLARCIKKLYTNRTRLAELGRGIGKFNQNYNWTKLGAEYVALVNRLGSR